MRVRVSGWTHARTHAHARTHKRQRPFIQITYQTDTNPGPVLALTDGHRLACLAVSTRDQPVMQAEDEPNTVANVLKYNMYCV